MHYLEMALELTQDQFEQLAEDARFREALLADIETGKVRVHEGRTPGWARDYAYVAGRLGWIIGRDTSGFYALPRAAARRRADEAPTRGTRIVPLGAAEPARRRRVRSRGRPGVARGGTGSPP